MGQPVKLSDDLVLDARVTAAIAERSIAGQIEYWAQLGKALEPLLRGDTALALRRVGSGRTLSEAIEQAGTAEGRDRTTRYLQSRPFPHFESSADHPGFLIRIDQDGSRTLGRFVNREFQALESAAAVVS